MSNSKGILGRPPFIPKPLDPNFDFALAGRHIRERRLQFRLSTQKLAELAGVARYTVIRIEQGLPCTGRTLHRVRSALHLFTDQLVKPYPEEDRFAVHRASGSRWNVSIPKAAYQKHLLDDDPIHVNETAERKRLGALGLQPFFTCILDCELPGSQMSQALMELHRPSWVDNHFGTEFVYCLHGPVVITIDGTPCRLEDGDAMSFDANLPHQYEPAFEVKDEPALILVVVVKKQGEKQARPAKAQG